MNFVYWKSFCWIFFWNNKLWQVNWASHTFNTFHLVDLNFNEWKFQTLEYLALTLKEENFTGEDIFRISRTLAKFVKMNYFFDPRKCHFAKINSHEIFQNWWFVKVNSREIFQELMKCEYWSFCLIQCLLNKVFSIPSAILSFVQVKKY